LNSSFQNGDFLSPAVRLKDLVLLLSCPMITET